MSVGRVVGKALLIGCLALGSGGCGGVSDDDRSAVMDLGAAGASGGQQQSVAIARDELLMLQDGAVSSTIELPAEFSPTISGFGPIVAATTPDQGRLAYLGWEPTPAFNRAEQRQPIEAGTPLGTQVLHIVDLDTDQHLEIRGVVSFALRPNGDVAYVQTVDTQVLSQVSQPTRLVHRSANGSETTVAEGGYFGAAGWVDGALLFAQAATSEPGPFMLKSYSPVRGESVDVGEGLSVFAMLDDASVLVAPNQDSFIGNLQRYEVGTGQLVDLEPAAHDGISDDIRIVGQGQRQGEHGEIVFHGSDESSTNAVVGRLAVIDDVVEVLDVVQLDKASIQGIEQIRLTPDGAIAGWGMGPRSHLVEFACAGECTYSEVDQIPPLHLVPVPEERR